MSPRRLPSSSERSRSGPRRGWQASGGVLVVRVPLHASVGKRQPPLPPLRCRRRPRWRPSRSSSRSCCLSSRCSPSLLAPPAVRFLLPPFQLLLTCPRGGGEVAWQVRVRTSCCC
eukprot:5225447-Alexandrium_andersonii.AAC.1